MVATSAFMKWIESLAAQRSFGPGDGLGTANLIDSAARRRGRDSIVTGEHLRLARDMGPSGDADSKEPLVVVPRFVPDYAAGDLGMIGAGWDRVEVECHGQRFTHMDALNHLMIDGAFYGGVKLDAGEPAPGVVDLAAQCFFTRAVVADIPAVRGTPWVSEDEPVTGDDIDRALGATEFVPGDALVLYMGRDRFEAAGHGLVSGRSGVPGERQPGVGEGGARWIADHGAAVVLWDFMDAVHDAHLANCVHWLIWAAGLVLVDNCDLGAAAASLGRLGRSTAALVVQPIGFPGGTGSMVEPFLVA